MADQSRPGPRNALHPGAPTEEGRIVVLVELDEGVRFVGNLVDTPLDAVANEMPVALIWREYDGVTLPQFVPAEVR